MTKVDRILGAGLTAVIVLLIAHFAQDSRDKPKQGLGRDVGRITFLQVNRAAFSYTTAVATERGGRFVVHGKLDWQVGDLVLLGGHDDGDPSLCKKAATSECFRLVQP
jgi:hypothetical protein